MATSMKKAVQWAINIANNNKYTYGFGQPPRDISFGNYNGTKFDCSGFVSYALYHGGYYNDNQYPFATSDEYNRLSQLGFTILPYSQVGINNLKSGMIVWYPQGSGHRYGHTGMICGKNRLVEAYTDEVPKAQQIRVTNDIDRGWQWVAFDPTQIDFDVGLWDVKSICALLGNIWYESTVNPNEATDTSAYGVGLIQWSNAGSWNNNWQSVLHKANAYGNPTTNPKQMSAQISAIEYELLDGTITESGGYIKTGAYPLTGEQFITNSKNKSIEYLTKCYSMNRGEYGPRHDNWQGVRKAKELYETLPNYNKTIQEIGFQNYLSTDEVLGEYYGVNGSLPSVDCAMYNAKLLYDTLLSGSDRPIINDRPKRKGMVFDYPYLYY